MKNQEGKGDFVKVYQRTLNSGLCFEARKEATPFGVASWGIAIVDESQRILIALVIIGC